MLKPAGLKKKDTKERLSRRTIAKEIRLNEKGGKKIRMKMEEKMSGFLRVASAYDKRCARDVLPLPW